MMRPLSLIRFFLLHSGLLHKPTSIWSAPGTGPIGRSGARYLVVSDAGAGVVVVGCGGLAAPVVGLLLAGAGIAGCGWPAAGVVVVAVGAVLGSVAGAAAGVVLRPCSLHRLYHLPYLAHQLTFASQPALLHVGGSPFGLLAGG